MSESKSHEESSPAGPEFGHFDAIIIGTGLAECALSGLGHLIHHRAFALAGKKVLHVDQSRRYGSA